MKSVKKPVINILRERFDSYSKNELYSIIMCGELKVDGETVRSPKYKISSDADIVIMSKKWVSRGGEKLDYALLEWKINVAGKVVLDAGASTGGFTDCLLQHGAARVHSVDVGYNQLDYRLRTDSRVNVLERTNIMAVTELGPRADFAVADLSFRSITGAANHILGLTADNMLIALIKPQFEITPAEGFDGVIRDPSLLREVLLKTAERLGNEKIRIIKAIKSPIKGGKGNTEYLFMLKLSDSCEREHNLQSGIWEIKNV